jgi:diguanylate cyclase (GGDEF)-like protein/PAS domain S-box-containing protein
LTAIGQVGFLIWKERDMVIKCISIYLFIGIMLLSLMFVNSFQRSKSSYAKAFGALSLTLQVYLLGYLMELNTESLKEMLFWNQVQYFGIPFFPALWLTVSMLYTGRGKCLKGFKGVLIFAVPVVTFAMRLTNGWHHLYYSKIDFQQFEGINLMLLTKGPWYLVQMAYVLVVLMLCCVFYYQRYKKTSGADRIQFRLLLLASVLPYIALVLVKLNIGGVGLDYTALVLPICILMIDFALTRYNFMEIKVLAREKVFEDSSAGMLILNRFYSVVDFNDASVSFFRWFGAEIVKEEQLDILLKEQAELLGNIKQPKGKVMHLNVGGEERYVSISVREILDKEEKVGFLVTFEDVTERELLGQRLVETANTDELSGLSNRRRFGECAEEAFKRARRYGEQLAVLMMDIDHFKNINDSFGHLAGDEVIRKFSELLSAEFRGTDVAGRMGGEEFAVVMLNTDAESAFLKAERFRRAVSEKHMDFWQQPDKVTVSIGVAEIRDETADFDALLKKADNALYEAKRAGRNCTVVDNQPIRESVS